MKLRGKSVKLLLVAFLLAALVLAEGCLGLFTLRVGSSQPGPLTNQPQVAVKVGFFGIPSEARLMVNDRLVYNRIVLPRGQVEALQVVDLQEGPNRFYVQLLPLLPLRSVEKSWTVVLDTRPPELSLEGPEVVRETSYHLTGRTEPGGVLTVTCGSDLREVKASETGAFASELELAAGPNNLSVEARDPAGNVTRAARELVCDQTAPAVQPLAPAAEAVLAKNVGKLKASVSDPGSGLVRVTLTLDGRELPPEVPTGDKGIYAWDPGILPEGRREVVLRAEDRAGWVSEQRYGFLVDSTEQLGLCTLTLGARGADVKQLQKRLVARGALDERGVTGTFDEATRAAVIAFQDQAGLKPDGVVGAATLSELGPKIVVYLDDFSLELVEGGRVLKRYPIAHGQPAYPTPRGQFVVADMVENPTWLPPDSAWAREAKAIPPGPGNPLGTRWIGLNSGVVGIHGTNAEGSIGSRASHGCIRMYVSDVEDLYSRISLGTPVSIR